MVSCVRCVILMSWITEGGLSQFSVPFMFRPLSLSKNACSTRLRSLISAASSFLLRAANHTQDPARTSRTRGISSISQASSGRVCPPNCSYRSNHAAAKHARVTTTITRIVSKTILVCLICYFSLAAAVRHLLPGMTGTSAVLLPVSVCPPPIFLYLSVWGNNLSKSCWANGPQAVVVLRDGTPLLGRHRTSLCLTLALCSLILAHIYTIQL